MPNVDIQAYPKVLRLNHEGSTPSSSSESLRLNQHRSHTKSSDLGLCTLSSYLAQHLWALYRPLGSKVVGVKVIVQGGARLHLLTLQHEFDQKRKEGGYLSGSQARPQNRERHWWTNMEIQIKHTITASLRVFDPCVILSDQKNLDEKFMDLLTSLCHSSLSLLRGKT